MCAFLLSKRFSRGRSISSLKAMECSFGLKIHRVCHVSAVSFAQCGSSGQSSYLVSFHFFSFKREGEIPTQQCSGIARRVEVAEFQNSVFTAWAGLDVLLLLQTIRGRYDVQTQIKFCTLLMSIALRTDPPIDNRVIAKGQTIEMRHISW